MKRLKEVFESLSFTQVRTYIQSGNVVFETKRGAEEALAAKIEDVIEQAFGFPVRTIVFSRARFLKIVDVIPLEWKNDHQYTAYVLFLWKEYDTKRTLDGLSITKGVDTVLYVKGAVLWHFKKKDYSRSGMHRIIGTPFYKQCTSRNVNTVRKLGKLLE